MLVGLETRLGKLELGFQTQTEKVGSWKNLWKTQFPYVNTGPYIMMFPIWSHYYNSILHQEQSHVAREIERCRKPIPRPPPLFLISNTALSNTSIFTVTPLSTVPKLLMLNATGRSLGMGLGGRAQWRTVITTFLRFWPCISWHSSPSPTTGYIT